MDNVTLIGMPGAGKSTIGVVLAKVLGYDFIDSDLLIQKSEGKLLWEIMRDCGNDGFNRIEERVNSEISVNRTVIATGGSVVYGPAAMKHLRSISTVVYLKVGCAILEKRLGDLTKRGVVLEPDQTLLDLYKQRVPLYERYSHITVNVGNKTVAGAASAICEALSRVSGKQ